jgi:hypothetical protein
MHESISRRSLIKGVSAAAAYGTLAASISAAVRAAEAQGAAEICLSLVYSNAPRAKFDARQYASTHLPLLKSIYGDSIERIELRTPRDVSAARADTGGKLVSARRGANTAPPPPILAATSMWIRDLKAYGEKTAVSAQRITKDLEDVVRDSRPIVQYDRTIAQLGDPRTAVDVQSQVMTYYFPASETSNFDAKYYGETVVPLMMKLYGDKAIRRVEINLGSGGQAGAKAAMVAAAHYYIRDRAAWDAAGMQAFPQLMAEAPKYTNIRPLMADMEVSAAG